MNDTQRSHIVETESFGDTFGPKAQRKRPRIEAGTFAELSKLGSDAYDAAASASLAAEMNSLDPFAPTSSSTTALDPSNPNPSNPSDSTAMGAGATHADYIEPIFAKGTSRRIYGELYKVIDSSDVVLHVLDARDPMGTMCESVLEYMRKEKAHKQVVLVINKCDLVPGWVTVRSFPSPSSLCAPSDVQDHFVWNVECDTGPLHPTPHPPLPHHRLPRLTQPLLRQRLPHPAPPPILAAPRRQETDQCWICRVSECREE